MSRVSPIVNYRHAFHAGNFADVLKHAVLARILVHLTRKEAPFRFIDTHAGAGRYDLSGDEARRSPEWREGIARVLTARPPAPVAELLRPYLQAVGPHDAEGRPASYPGSPAIAQTLHARAGSHRALRSEPGRTRGADRRARARRAAQHRRHGRLCRAQRLPAAQGAARRRPDRPAVRGARRSRAASCAALERALRKWPTGTYVAWRPIRDARADARFLNSVAALGAPNILRLELDVGPGPVGAHGQEPLARAGLLVVNPPHTLFEEARALLPWLAQDCSAASGGGKHLCAWLTEPK